MTTLHEAAQQALEMLEDTRNGSQRKPSEPVITALRAALAESPTNQCGETCERAKLCAACARELAESVQEPVKFWPLAPLTGYYDVGGKRVWLEKDEPFPAPPQRKPLTEEEIQDCFYAARNAKLGSVVVEIARAIERAHGIGGQP